MQSGAAKALPIFAQRKWGGGPPPQAVVEGERAQPLRQPCGLPPPHLRVARKRGGSGGAGLRGSAVLFAAATLAACTSPADAPRTPKIVSLNPCADAILAEVTGPGQLLAISHYSADPRSRSMDAAKARQYPATRGTLEAIIALHPDVVVDGTFVAPATAAAYRRLGFALETLPIAATVADSHAQIRRLALLAGHADRGEALIQRINAALLQAAPPQNSAPIPALVWEPGGIVPGDRTLIADLLRRTGFANFSAARGLGQADLLPLERVLADPPRVILAAGETRALTHPALAHLRGVAMAPLDPALLYCGGPTIIRAAARLAEVRRALGLPTPSPSRKREGGNLALSSPLAFAGGASLSAPLPLAAGASFSAPLPLAARASFSAPLPLAGGVGGGQAARHNP